MGKRLVFVEDDDMIRQNYTELLTDAGFSVEAFSEVAPALAAIRSQLPDIALLDVAIGDENDAGFNLCAEIRRFSESLPVVFFTSHDADTDRISGLRLGADDYLTKDISIDYLTVRLHALLRRVRLLQQSAAGAAPAIVGQSGRLRLDAERSQAYWDDQVIPLTLTQYWILEKLASEPGKLRTTNELMRAAQIVVEQNTIVAHIKAIRDAFRRQDPAFAGIRTERAKGYRWAPA